MFDFDGWNNLKQAIHKSERGPHIKERELWWCSLGINIGNEMNGKHELFHRPILIIKKLSGDSVLAAPITSKWKEGTWYQSIITEGEQRTVCIHQLRVINTKRLGKYMSRLPESEFEKVQAAIKHLYNW